MLCSILCPPCSMSSRSSGPEGAHIPAMHNVYHIGAVREPRCRTLQRGELTRELRGNLCAFVRQAVVLVSQLACRSRVAPRLVLTCQRGMGHYRTTWHKQLATLVVAHRVAGPVPGLLKKYRRDAGGWNMLPSGMIQRSVLHLSQRSEATVEVRQSAEICLLAHCPAR